MKKTILITLLLSIISFSAEAQLLKLGIKAGLNYANFAGTELKTDAITSYHAGIVAQIVITDGFSFQPELLYTTQGASYNNVEQEIKNELGDISIPAILKIDLNKTFSLELGPQVLILLSEKNNFNVEDSNTFDFSVVGGLGIKVTKSIFVQARYGLGLTEISKDAKAKNSVVQVSAGILF